ncbi:protein translocase SEC61 complex subunit gamma [Methermicoccus shengliensis]|nr:protein translocase SEC61 complex subunit gamma [Methermicoccus shengliensis]
MDKFEASNMTTSWMSAERIMSTINEYIRVLRFARKPTREEFYAISKVAAAGIVLIGLIGFVIYLLLTVLPRYG